MAQSQSTEPLITTDKIRSLAEDVIRKGEENAEKAEETNAKPIKLFGVFEVDPGLVAYLQAGYNVFADFAEKLLSSHSYAFGGWVAARLGIKNPQTAKNIAAATTLGVGAAIKTAGYISPITDTYRVHHEERAAFARKLAPVLDDLKGSHSAQAFNSVTMAQNEMIFAHRQRMLKEAHIKNSSNVIDLLINAGPNLAFSLMDFNTMRRLGLSPEGLSDYRNNQGAHQNNLRNLFETLANTGTAGIANHIKKSSEKTLRRSLQPYSALEMIMTLQDQVAQKPNASSFRTPRDGDSYPLDEYIQRILMQHQKDMADISHEHTELRSALKDDLEAISKPIAEAMKKGDLSAISLVRWIGEGQLIKDKGRRLASVDEVKKLLGAAEKAPMPSIVVDPKEYYVDAAFTHKDLEQALQTLQGQERSMFAALFPDAVLMHAGMKEAEVKSIRAMSMQQYEAMLAATVAAMASKSDEELEREGMAKAEIKQLREVADAFKENGEKAIHEARTSPANANGIERVLTNWAVPHVKGGRAHFGTLVRKGAAQAQDIISERAAESKAPTESHAAAVEKAEAEPALEQAR